MQVTRSPCTFLWGLAYTVLAVFYIVRVCVCVCVCVYAQPCPTLFDPMDYSPPGSSVNGIFQGKMLEWVAISCSRRSSQPRDRSRVSCIGRWVLYHWATRKVLLYWTSTNTYSACVCLHLNVILRARTPSSVLRGQHGAFFIIYSW